MKTRSQSTKTDNVAIEKRSSIQQRFLTASVIITVGIVVLQVYPPLLALIIGNLTTIEYYNITCANKSNKQFYLTLIQYNVVTICAVYSQQCMQVALLCVMFSTILVELYTAQQTTQQSFTRLCTNIFTHVYITALWSHTVLLLQPIHKHIDYLNGSIPLTNQQYQITTIIFVILATGNGENGALLFGSLYGKRSAPLAAHISPNKSLIGAVAQLISTMLTCILYTYCNSIKPIQYNIIDGVVLGVLLGIGGITGDLFESYLKRCYHIKDSNSIIKLPGIGGVLDRIDGLLFNFVFTYYYYTYRGFIT